MDEKEIASRKELLSTDSFFKRITKSKNDYYKEGIVICGNYYKIVLEKKINEIKDEKETLERKFREKDVWITMLKEQVKTMKQNFQKNQEANTTREDDIFKSSTAVTIEMLLKMLESVCTEDEAITEQLSELVKEYSDDNKLSVGGISIW